MKVCGGLTEYSMLSVLCDSPGRAWGPFLNYPCFSPGPGTWWSTAKNPWWGVAVTLIYLFTLHRGEAADGTFHTNFLCLPVEICSRLNTNGYKSVGNLCLLCRFGFGFSRPCDPTRDHGGRVSTPGIVNKCAIINNPGLMRPGEGFPLLAHVQCCSSPCAAQLECWDWPCPGLECWLWAVAATRHWHLPRSS